jgi:eukaryotic-like serine/threonine-protein kinase
VVEIVKGTVIAERYRLDRRIAEGGMGVLWAATHLVTRAPAALKLIKPGIAGDPQVRRRILREARAAAAVRHPHVARLYDVIELPDGSPVLVMELLEGEPLRARLRRDGRLPLGEALGIVLPVISAVRAAHALGITHRDLKPENIFLTPTEGVKVLDFGIAKFAPPDIEMSETRSEALTLEGTMLGTPSYMAPEQVLAEGDVDHRADIWALGVILHEVLCGEPPIAGESALELLRNVLAGAVRPIRTVLPDLPEDIADLVARMLTVKRDLRLADLEEARAVLERHAGAPASIASAERASAPAPRPSAGPGIAGETPVGGESLARRARQAGRGARIAIAIAVAAGVGVTAAGVWWAVARPAPTVIRAP